MSKLIKYILPITLSIFLFSMSACSDEPDVKPGMWSWSMTMEMAGMKMPPITYTSCVTKEDLVPQQSTPNQDCKILEKSVEGNTILWTIECSSAGAKSMSKGKMTYTKDTAKGEIDVSTQGMEMKSRLSGKRIGNCK